MTHAAVYGIHRTEKRRLVTEQRRSQVEQVTRDRERRRSRLEEDSVVDSAEDEEDTVVALVVDSNNHKPRRVKLDICLFKEYVFIFTYSFK